MISKFEKYLNSHETHIIDWVLDHKNRIIIFSPSHKRISILTRYENIIRNNIRINLIKV